MSGAVFLTAALVIGFLWGRIWTLRSLNRKWRAIPLNRRRALHGDPFASVSEPLPKEAPKAVSDLPIDHAALSRNGTA